MNTKTLSQLEDKFIGQPGSEVRNGYEKEIIGALSHYRGTSDITWQDN